MSGLIYFYNFQKKTWKIIILIDVKGLTSGPKSWKKDYNVSFLHFFTILLENLHEKTGLHHDLYRFCLKLDRF